MYSFQDDLPQSTDNYSSDELVKIKEQKTEWKENGL